MAATKIEPNDSMPLFLWIISTSIAFIMGLIVTIVNYLRRELRIEKALKRILSKESYKIIGRRINLYLLGALFFVLLGVSGLVKCYIINSSTVNQQILSLPLVMGIGIFCGGRIGIRMKLKRNS